MVGEVWETLGGGGGGGSLKLRMPQYKSVFDTEREGYTLIYNILASQLVLRLWLATTACDVALLLSNSSVDQTSLFHCLLVYDRVAISGAKDHWV